MKILLKHDTQNSLEMAREVAKWLSIEDVTDSSMEDSWSFKFEGEEFYIAYDANSERNERIFPYIIESVKENSQQGTETTKALTQKICHVLKSKGLEYKMV